MINMRFRILIIIFFLSFYFLLSKNVFAEVCSGGTCPDGRTWEDVCDRPCSDPERDCYASISCLPPINCTTSGCPDSTPHGCEPNSCGTVRCASGGYCYTDCTGCSSGPPPSNPVDTPTPTPTPSVGYLMGRVWNDANCNGEQDEITNHLSDPDMVQNPANTCDAAGATYLNLNAQVIYRNNATSVTTITKPDKCNPGPAWSVDALPGNYNVWLQPPAGWISTIDTQTVTVTNGQQTHQWFGVFSCPVLSAPTNLTPSGTLDPTFAGGVQSWTKNLCWNAVPSAQKYSVRIDKDSPSWGWNCNALNAGDSCNETTDTCYSYTFVPGHTYTWSVVPLVVCKTENCENVSSAPVSVTIPGCTVDVADQVLTEGAASTVVPNLSTFGSPTIHYIQYIISDENIAVSNPSTNPNSPYSTSISGRQAGTTTLTTKVFFNMISPNIFYPYYLACSDTSNIVVNPANAWFQTQGGDIHAQGSVISTLPESLLSPYFSLASSFTPSFPGVVSYGTTVDFGEGSVSEKGWLTKSSFSTSSFDYDYFFQKLSPTDTFNCGSPTTSSGSYKVTGDCTLTGSDLDFGTSKVTVLVDGNLNIGRNITLDTANGGFVAFIVKGNIQIDPSIGRESSSVDPNIQGLYIANGEFKTNEGDSDSSARFIGKGIFKANTFNLERDLGADNADTSAELFIFDPSLVMNTPTSLTTSQTSWLEVNP